MKNVGSLIVTTCILLLLGTPVLSQDTSAVNVQTSCAHWTRLRVDKHKQFKGDADDLYNTGLCLGYFDGLMDGMDNTGGWRHSDGSIGVFEIKRSAISSNWDVIQAFYTYLNENPLAKGKPAWSVLQSVLITNGLASFVPQQAQGTVLSNECKTGATNILTEFDSDPDLKVIGTPTLGSAVDKLIGCWNTPHIGDTETALVLSATAEAQSVLVSRAMIVLKRHALVPEYKAENLGSTQKKTVSSVPAGVVTEQ